MAKGEVVTQDKAQETLNQTEITPEGVDGPQRPLPDPLDDTSAGSVPDPVTDPAAAPDTDEADRPRDDRAQADAARPDLPPSDIDADLAATPLPAHHDAAPPRQRGGVVPMVLGGAVAAALGFGAAQYLHTGSLWPLGVTQDDLTNRLNAQELALDAMAERLDAAPRGPDIAPLSREIADLRADLVAQSDALRPEITALADRVAALETGAPAGEGAGMIAAWETEIEALKSALGAQDMRLQAIAAEANSRLEAAQEEIRGIEESATNAAAAIARRGAMSRVFASLDAGGPYAEALAEVVGEGVMPQMLASLSEGGAPTLPQLQEHFPAAARAALAAARAENLAGEAGGFMGFLRGQFDVRSTAERAGDDPDAILSRAEARLSEYDLDAALAELAQLPEVVRAAMGDWLAMADTRKAALAEADALAAALNDN